MANIFERIGNRIEARAEKAADFVGKNGSTIFLTGSILAAELGAGATIYGVGNVVNDQVRITEASSPEVVTQLEGERTDHGRIAYGGLLVGLLGTYLAVRTEASKRGYVLGGNSIAPTIILRDPSKAKIYE